MAALASAAAQSSSSDDDDILIDDCASDGESADGATTIAASPLRDVAAVAAAAARTAGTLGYAVLDGALSPAAASAVAAEVRGAPYETYEFETVSGVRRADGAIAEVLVGSAAAARYPSLGAVAAAIADAARRAAPTLGLDVGGHAVIKLQRNVGGAFPLHYDNNGPPSRRGLTAILYLNDGYEGADGGRLVVRPFLRRPRSVSPRPGRLVLLRSDRVLHGVTPWRGAAPRYAASLWFRTRDEAPQISVAERTFDDFSASRSARKPTLDPDAPERIFRDLSFRSSRARGATTSGPRNCAENEFDSRAAEELEDNASDRRLAFTQAAARYLATSPAQRRLSAAVYGDALAAAAVDAVADGAARAALLGTYEAGSEKGDLDVPSTRVFRDHMKASTQAWRT